MSMKFEELPNEILFVIFDYMNIQDLFCGFWQLNQRFNQLIRIVKNLSLTIEKNESELISLFADQISRLVIKTSNDIDLSQFGSVHSLILHQMTKKQFNQIRSKFMPRLVYISSSLIYDDFMILEFPQRIFSNEFSSLHHVKLGLTISSHLFSWSQSPSLLSVSIYCMAKNQIPLILKSCPNLTFLQVSIIYMPFESSLSIPTITNHPLKQFILIDLDQYFSAEDVNTVLSYMVNIERINLTFSCDILFIDFLQCMLNQLKYLHRFDCHIDGILTNTKVNVEIIQNIHPCFNRIRYIEDNRIFTTKINF